MIKAANLTKKYRKKIAVDNISFEVETGKVTGFLGPNGAGKSTTMRLMLGLDRGSGHTTFDGKRLIDYTNPSSVVGILLEAKAFHPTRSARNHLRALAALGNIPSARVNEVLELVGLKEVAKKAPGKFSLGMSQRLGLAAAILGKPKYLLLDEPANGLDPEGIKWLRDFLKNYAAEGNSVFVSSHLLSEMSLMADNVIVIGKGKLITSTSIKDLVSGSSHKSVFVRASEMKKLESILKKADQKFETEDDGLLIHGVKSDDIGKQIAGHNLTILELANRSASLEEVFFELTADAQEYKTESKESKKG
jgi:ABC-2 type transport system ATP-binding protein